jgi:hypothetical protein
MQAQRQRERDFQISYLWVSKIHPVLGVFGKDGRAGIVGRSVWELMNTGKD